MKDAAEAQEFEQAALRAQPAARGALAARAPARRQRVGRHARRVAVAVDGTDANAQVFQVRDGVLSDRQSLLPRERTARRDVGEVADEFIAAVLRAARSRSRRRSSSSARSRTREALAEALAERRGGRVEVRAAERGDKRRILELAERNARLALDQEKLRPSAGASSASRRSTGSRRRSALDALPLRIECFDISNLMGTHTVASMVVFEGGAPKKSDYRRFTHPRRSRRACPTTSRRWRRCSSRRLAQWETPAGPLPARPQAQRVLRDAART